MQSRVRVHGEESIRVHLIVGSTYGRMLRRISPDVEVGSTRSQSCDSLAACGNALLAFSQIKPKFSKQMPHNLLRLIMMLTLLCRNRRLQIHLSH